MISKIVIRHHQQNSLLNVASSLQDERPFHYEIRDDLFSGSDFPNIDGLSSGIAAIDERTNGIHPGQLISVCGPLNDINNAFLYTMATYNAFNKKKIDYILTQSSFKTFHEQLFGTWKPEHREEIENTLTPYLRFPDLNIGDPDNAGWNNYKEQLKMDAPDAIIFDGVEMIETVLGEKGIASQLKKLAVDLGIPVIVHVPLHDRRLPMQSTDLPVPRTDFDELSDALVAFTPLFVCDYYYGKTEKKKFYSLKTNIASAWCPCPKHEGYVAELELQFEERYLRFH